MKKFLTTVLLGAAVVFASNAIAHRDHGDIAPKHINLAPKHGGVMQVAGDMSFELVGQGDGVAVYVEDGSKPVATQGMSGKLTVFHGSDKSEADLKPAGNNTLEAKGMKFSPGAKVVAVLNTDNKKAITVRFIVK